MMRTLTKNIVISLVCSCVFHLVMLGVLSRMRLTSMPGFQAQGQTTSEQLQPIQVQTIDDARLEQAVKDAQARDMGLGGGAPEEKVFDNAEADDAVARIFEQQQLTDNYPTPIRFTGIEKAEQPPKREEQPLAPATAPRPDIVQIDMKTIPMAERLAPGRVTIPKVERVESSELKLPSLLPHGELTATAATPFEIGMRMGKPRFGLPKNIGDDEVARGVTGVYKGGDDALRLTHGLDVSPNGAKAVPFDDFVNVRMLVKDDPKGNGGYFVISMEANEKSKNVQEIPKDILLVLDRSSSISNKQFYAFKQASYKAMGTLHATDRFNVVTFTSKPVARFRTFVPAIPQNIQLATSFIKQLTNRGTTSVFGAIEPFIRQSRAQDGRPLTIFLMTDGVSTVNIYNDDEFLRQVKDINPGHVSIFPLSVGEDANQDLLDFLGFQNRGGSLHTEKPQGADEALARFITKHNGLLIRNLEYVSDARTVREIYPRKLQHLYRDSDVKLYGRFNAGDTSIVLDIVGIDSQNQHRSLIFQCVFAECRRTQEPLDSMWAARKILDLVSLKMIAKDEYQRKQIDSQIKQVSDTYNLAVPY